MCRFVAREAIKCSMNISACALWECKQSLLPSCIFQLQFVNFDRNNDVVSRVSLQWQCFQRFSPAGDIHAFRPRTPQAHLLPLEEAGCGLHFQTPSCIFFRKCQYCHCSFIPCHISNTGSETSKRHSPPELWVRSPTHKLSQYFCYAEYDG